MPLYQIFQIITAIFSLIRLSGAFSEPSDIYLGASFRVVYIDSSSGGLGIDRLAQQHRSSFVTAINQINNKTDGFYDDLLPNTNIKFAVDWGQKNVISNPTNNLYFDGSLCSYYIHSQFPNVSMVVTTSPYETTSALEEIFIGWNVPILINNSTRTEFSHGLNFPYNLRIPAAESYDAVVLANLIHNYYKWNKVSVFYTTDTYGQDCYYEFTKYGDIYGLKYLSTYPLSVGSNDYEKIVEEVETVGSTIFVLLMDLSVAQTFLLSVYKLGMLKLGTQVIGTSKMATSILWENFPSNEINEIMKGVLVVQYSPKLYFELPLGKGYVDIIKGLQPTITYNINGTQVCSTATDSAGNQLYNIVYNNVEYCTGFDMHSIGTVSSAIIDPSTLMTYNSVITYATAADFLIRNEIEITGVNMHAYLTNNTIAIRDSSVGEISFSSGDTADSQFGLGDRQSGQIYTILNFHSITSGFVTVGVWASNTSGFSCYDEIILPNGSFNISNQCNNPIYRTYDSISQPLDHPHDIYITLSSSLKSYYITMGIIILIENVIIMGILINYRHTRAVKNGQLFVMLTIATGVLFGAVRPIIGALPVRIVNCQVQLFVEHLCFRLFFGTLMLKLWRIHKIVNASSFKRVKIAQIDVLKIIGYHLLFLLVILFLIIGFDGVVVGQDTYVISNQKHITKVCLYSNTPASGILLKLLYLLEVCYLLMGFYYLFKARAVPPSVNETAIIGPTLLGGVISITVIAAVVLALNLNASQVEMAINIAFTILLLIGSFYKFVKKIMQIYDEVNNKNTHKPGQVIPLYASSTSQSKDVTNVENKSESNEDLNYMKKQIKSKKDYIQKAKFLQDHMDLCKTLLMSLADDEDFTSSNQSNERISNVSKGNMIDSSNMIIDNTNGLSTSHFPEGKLYSKDDIGYSLSFNHNNLTVIQEKNEVELSSKV